MRNPKEQTREILKNSRRLCVLTGAGISAESGLATFRDSDGLWNNHSVEDVATPEGFLRDPEGVWNFYLELKEQADRAAPNPAHAALTAFGGKDGRRVTVLTQNVDGLHERAGGTEVITLHGSLYRARCSSCVKNELPLPGKVPPLPKCECGGLVRPDIVWFGEPLDDIAMGLAAAAVGVCDAFMVVGTSAQVFPAASFAYIALRQKKPVILVNKEATPLNEFTNLAFTGKAGTILPELLS